MMTNIYFEWEGKSPYQWDYCDVVLWLIDVCIKYHIPLWEVTRLFDTIPCGKELCELSFEYFLDICPKYGLLIFEELHLTIQVFIT